MGSRDDARDTPHLFLDGLPALCGETDVQRTHGASRPGDDANVPPPPSVRAAGMHAYRPTVPRWSRPNRRAVGHARPLMGLLLLVAAAVQLSPGAAAAQVEPAIVQLFPGDDMQAAVDSNPVGTTFVLKAGVHRLQRIVPRDGNSFIGEPGTVLSGSRVLTSFTRAGSLWVASDQTQQVRSHGSCMYLPAGERYEGCKRSEQLFIDGVPLWQVTSRSDVEPGTWYFDYAADAIYFADDPTGRLVETSVTEAAFTGTAQGVTIQNLVIEQYASRAQRGAIHGNGSSGWIVENNEIRLNHGVGLRIGDGMQVLNNSVHHNGQLGMGGSGDNVLIEGNTIADNNIAGFLIGWEAGGTKFVKTRNLVVRNNYVHDNHGPGLWTDIDNIDSLIEGNRVEWNSYAGIKHEISYAAVIRNNIAGYNGLGKDAWLWGAQIQVQNSSDVEIYGNTVTVGLDGGDGIGVINQSRGSGAYGPYVSVNIYVHDNEVTHFANVGQSGVVDDTSEKLACSAAGNNRFDRNVYNVLDDDASRWEWCAANSWREFTTAGREALGTVNSPGEPTAVTEFVLPLATLAVLVVLTVPVAVGWTVIRKRSRVASKPSEQASSER